MRTTTYKDIYTADFPGKLKKIYEFVKITLNNIAADTQVCYWDSRECARVWMDYSVIFQGTKKKKKIYS